MEHQAIHPNSSWCLSRKIHLENAWPSPPLRNASPVISNFYMGALQS